jgi:imidazolonepropionase-like amidohydrolase
MVFALALTLAGYSASAQDAKKTELAKDAKEAKKPAPLAFIGADIYTVTKGVLRNGIVIVENGKIKAVGQDIEIPEGAAKIDVTGKVITPGLVTINAANIAIRGGGGGGPRGGGPPRAGGATDRVADSLNPFDRNILFCLGSGITTACVEVGAGAGARFGRNGEVPEDLAELIDLFSLDDTRLCPCCGLPIAPTEPIGPAPQAERTARRHAILKMTYGDMSPMLVKETPFYHLPAGSLTGALNRHQWREQIKRAKQQAKAPANDDDGGGFGGGGANRQVAPEMIKLVEKKIPLRTEAYSAEQMRDMIALAKELDYELILDGVHEGWIIPGELSAAKVQTVLTPRARRRPNPGKEETSGSSIETSGALEKAGVPFAVAPLGASVSLDGIPGRDLTSLALEAAFAVRGGASEQAALASVTIVPARMLGLGDKIGSIEEGKDADLLILDGPPLDYRTYVEKAYVGGKVYYDRTKDRIYPETPKR